MSPPVDPPKRILTIGIDEPIGEIVAALLRTARYECDAVWEHEAILEVLKRAGDYDLVFCQVAALEHEKEFLAWALGDGKDIPIVTTAGRSPGGIPEVILERCTFLQMPFEKQQLLDVVKETLRR